MPMASKGTDQKRFSQTVASPPVAIDRIVRSVMFPPKIRLKSNASTAQSSCSLILILIDLFSIYTRPSKALVQ